MQKKNDIIRSCMFAILPTQIMSNFMFEADQAKVFQANYYAQRGFVFTLSSHFHGPITILLNTGRKEVCFIPMNRDY